MGFGLRIGGGMQKPASLCRLRRIRFFKSKIKNHQSSGASQSPERRGRRSQVSNNKQKGETESEQLKATGETRREPTRLERTDHPPEASLGWRPEMASSSVGSEP